MKFSYKLIKKYLPDINTKEELVDSLNMHSFETEMMGGDIFDVSVPSNRYSSVAYHIGVAREAATVMNLNNSKIPNIDIKEWKGRSDEFSLKIKNKDLCPRYTAWYFENIEVKESPKWMQDILVDCGLRPINNVVDIMNYAMLETGQPLHAFDYDKIKGKKIVVRNAKHNEEIISIEGNKYNLDPSILVIADKEKPLAIAGIKGGKEAEVTSNTTKIIVESANFDPISIYNTSRKINLSTDASLRFSHGLHKRLVLEGLERVGELLNKIIKNSKPNSRINSNSKIELDRKITFDFNEFNFLMGMDVEQDKIKNTLINLGFKIEGDKVCVPPVRDDIYTEEDLIEEVARVFGFNDIKSKSPQVRIVSSNQNNIFTFRNEVKQIMIGLGYSEVYNYSFVGDENYGKIELENFISEDKKFLRSSLESLILGNIKENLKYYNEVRIFEIGKVFGESEERDMIGIGVGLKDNSEVFFELKGVIEGLLDRLGTMEYYMPEIDGDELGVKIKVNSSEVGWIRKRGEYALAEIKADILMKLIKEEISFEEFPKYPAVLRDISVLVDNDIRIGELIESIQNVDVDLIEDVDLIDEYFGDDDGKQSITFRIRFRADDRTLLSNEVGEVIKKIEFLLKNKFMSEIK